jgi:hypothetical protein
MMTSNSFPRGVPFVPPAPRNSTGGESIRRFSSNRFATFNAVQANEVQAVSCMSVPSFIVVDDGGNHVAVERQVVVGA